MQYYLLLLILMIKCSQCEMEFVNGHEYRIHWEKEHLDNAIEVVKKMKTGIKDIKKSLDK